MTDELLVSFRSEVSGRTVVVSDEGDSVWGYLTRAGTLQPERDCWLFNTPEAPLSPDISEYRRTRRPPPAPAAMVGPGGVQDPPRAERWSVRWSQAGESVAIALDGVDDVREPVVVQVPDFGDRFWTLPVYDARTDQILEKRRALLDRRNAP